MEEEYRIQQRQFSPDVIERNVGTKEKPVWKVYIAVISDRNDIMAHAILKWLNLWIRFQKKK